MNFADLYKKLQAIEENAPVAPVHTDAAGDSVEECGGMMSARPEQQDNVTMNVSMNGSGKGGIKDLMAILKNIEDHGPTPDHSDHDMIVGMEDFKNSMAGASGQHTMGIDAVTATGDDLASKGGEAPKVNGGGNPMQEAISQRLQKMYDTIKEERSDEAWYNPATWGAAGGSNTQGGAATGNPKIAAQGKKAGATQAVPAGQAAKPARPAAQPDPNVMALQQKLIAAGATIKADGIMGPATRAAQAQFPNVTTQTDAEKAVAADMLSANDGTGQNGGAEQARNPNAGLTPDDPRWQGPKPVAAPVAAPAAPAAPTGVQAQGDDEGNTTITRPDGSTMVVGPDGKQIMPGSNPNLPQNKGVINTVKNAVTGQGDFQKPTGFIPPAAPTAESVTFGEDPALARIVQLARG